MRRAPEILRSHAPQLSDRRDAIAALNAGIEECAALCDHEADEFQESGRTNRQDGNYELAKKHFDMGDEIRALALKIRAIKSDF